MGADAHGHQRGLAVTVHIGILEGIGASHPGLLLAEDDLEGLHPVLGAESHVQVGLEGAHRHRKAEVGVGVLLHLDVGAELESRGGGRAQRGVPGVFDAEGGFVAAEANAQIVVQAAAQHAAQAHQSAEVLIVASE